VSTEEHERLSENSPEAQAAKEEARRAAHARAWELARQQGVKPIQNMDELKGDFWPEEESVDEFLAWVRELRQSDKPRNLPE
jgi:glycerol-3-phosphate O-acyltransferase